MLKGSPIPPRRELTLGNETPTAERGGGSLIFQEQFSDLSDHSFWHQLCNIIQTSGEGTEKSFPCFLYTSWILSGKILLAHVGGPL